MAKPKAAKRTAVTVESLWHNAVTDIVSGKSTAEESRLWLATKDAWNDEAALKYAGKAGICLSFYASEWSAVWPNFRGFDLSPFGVGPDPLVAIATLHSFAIRKAKLKDVDASTPSTLNARKKRLEHLLERFGDKKPLVAALRSIEASLAEQPRRIVTKAEIAI